MTNHTAAIHVLKARLALSDDDYRALLVSLTGHASSKALNDVQRGRVRDHLQGLAERMGVAAPSRAATGAAWRKRKEQASPQERKVWAMWLALGRAGVVADTTERALHAWVHRTVHVDALRFCNGAQLHTLIEALKDWQRREGLPGV